jgi:hypothetical protein
VTNTVQKKNSCDDFKSVFAAAENITPVEDQVVSAVPAGTKLVLIGENHQDIPPRSHYGALLNKLNSAGADCLYHVANIGAMADTDEAHFRSIEPRNEKMSNLMGNLLDQCRTAVGIFGDTHLYVESLDTTRSGSTKSVPTKMAKKSVVTFSLHARSAPFEIQAPGIMTKECDWTRGLINSGQNALIKNGLPMAPLFQGNLELISRTLGDLKPVYLDNKQALLIYSGF